MPSRSGHASRSASDAPAADETTITNLRVSGRLPAGLCGQFVQIGPNPIEGMAHTVTIDARRAVAYRNRWIATVGDDVVTAYLAAFGRSILAFGDGVLAYELSPRLDTVGPVDLAGARRSLAAHAKFDPHTGELHLFTFGASPPQLHVAVSRGRLTRTVRSLDDAPGRIRQLELTRDDIVLMADGFVGAIGRAGLNTRTTWFEVDTEACHIASAYAHGETIVVHATGPSLVRWTLDRRTATAHREVIDARFHTFSTSNRQQPDAAQRFLWTVGAATAHKHDLLTGTRRSHDFGDGRILGELVFVADGDRRRTEDAGWLVGFVRDEASDQAEFVVLDAEAIERPAVATVPIPRPIANGASGIWIPAGAAPI
jgi:carotenoid cleavage dioxygenase